MTVRLPTKHIVDVVELDCMAGALRIVVVEMITRYDQEEVHEIVGKAWPVTSGPDSRVFELVWPRFLSYNVTMESNKLPEENEKFENPLREYTSSRYLAFAKADTFCVEGYRDPAACIRHWNIAGCDQVIDVLAWEEPELREIEGYVLPEFGTRPALKSL